MRIHPQILEKNGNKEFVVLPYEEFIQMQETITDYEDLMELQRTKSELKDDPELPLSEVRSSLNI
ncbi:MAG: type II toxin-antitoxin system Phd/YefM family antitoxin [Nitrospirales bacterium]|nr:type II toxin-antitoxin system Phd/YefM family antitoxin [Nitrospirales bacterium]